MSKKKFKTVEPEQVQDFVNEPEENDNLPEAVQKEETGLSAKVARKLGNAQAEHPKGFKVAKGIALGLLAGAIGVVGFLVGKSYATDDDENCEEDENIIDSDDYTVTEEGETEEGEITIGTF